MQSKQLPITTTSSDSRVASSSVSPSDGYWRGIEELERTPEFEEMLHREFPQAASEFPEGVSRRRWLKLMSASLALGGMSAGCRYGPHEIASMVVRPPNTIPGVPKHYATNFELAERAVHLLVTNLDGRPLKIEGNPEHPLMRASEPNEVTGENQRFASAGSDVFSQACVLSLYDPDRTSRVSRLEGESRVTSSWDEFTSYAADRMEELRSNGGKGLAILMPPSLSPTVNRQVARVAEQLPELTVCQFSSVDTSPAKEAAATVAGEPAELLLDLREATIICCLDSDLLGSDPNSIVYSRQFSRGRVPSAEGMNRLYAVESNYTVTGSSADSRLPLRSDQVGAFLVKLESRIDELLAGAQPAEIDEDAAAFDEIASDERLERFIESMASDLLANRGSSVISVGSHQPLNVQIAALRLNNKLENIGKTVRLLPSRSVIEGVDPVSLLELTESIQGGEIDQVWILGGNPVYGAPGDVDLEAALKGLDQVVYLAEFNDETAAVSNWVLPLAHPLESWGDVRGADGTYGICQPQILPLLNGKSVAEILTILLGQPQSGEEIVRSTAASVVQGGFTPRAWREALHSGFVPDSQFAPLEGDFNFEAPAPDGVLDTESIDVRDMEVVFRPSDSLYDGRFAKNVWLQELPQPMTKIVWDNAAIMSPQTADVLGVEQGELLVLLKDKQQIELPVFKLPGHAHGSITAHLGYGRVCRDEAVMSDEEVTVGQNVNSLRTAESMHLLSGVEARPTSKKYKLVTTQLHFAIDDLGLEITKERSRTLVREGTVEQIVEGGEGYVEHLGTHHPPLDSLWEEPIERAEEDPTVANQWGMTVDLSKCTGCSACVIACQAENNIPVVGKEQVARNREMHWIRIDRYFRGDMNAPKIVNQPVACVHCETAPCEQVCPVAATVHTEEGVNAMAYNRCIGTRYCANNCPYKVRRFNYFNYNTEYGYFYGWEQREELEKANRKLQQLVLNPEVTVRGRGVMEKCTYCIQRIQNVKIQARTEGRGIEDGEVVTACQAACPTQAIVFGNIKDPSSRVSALRENPRAYAMLAELNVKPRTLYLARVRNTHPLLKTRDQLADPHAGHAHGHDNGEHGAEGEHAAEEHAAEEHAGH